MTRLACGAFAFAFALATSANGEATARDGRIGTILPPLTLSTRHDVWWTAPRATTAAGVSESVGSDESEGATARGRLFAQASWRIASIDASLHTRPTSDEMGRPPYPSPAGSTLWLGVRLVVLEAADGSIAFGVYSRPGIGIGADAAHRWDAGFALGGAHGRWSWLTDLGARYRLVETLPSTDALVVYLTGGATYDLLDQVRLFLVTPIEGLIVGSASDADLDGGVFVATGAEIRHGPLLFMPYLSGGGVIEDAPIFDGGSLSTARGLGPDLGVHLGVALVPEIAW